MQRGGGEGGGGRVSGILSCPVKHPRQSMTTLASSETGVVLLILGNSGRIWPSVSCLG